MRDARLAGLVVALASVARVAHADDATPAAAPLPPASMRPPELVDVDNVPVFPDLDRMGPASRFGVELTYVHLTDSANTRSSDIFIQSTVYIDARVNPNVGVYAQLPFSFAHGTGDTSTALGGLEVGGYFLAREVAPGLTLVPHAGFVLPNGTKGSENDLALYGGFVRLNDLVQGLPRGATLRAGGSLLDRYGRAFFRVDADLDANVYESGSAGNAGETFPTVIRLNGGIGYDQGDVAVAFESTNAIILPKNGASSAHLDNLSLSVAGSNVGQRVHPYLSLTVPISNDDTTGFYNIAITAGVSIHIPQF